MSGYRMGVPIGNTFGRDYLPFRAASVLNGTITNRTKPPGRILRDPFGDTFDTYLILNAHDVILWFWRTKETRFKYIPASGGSMNFVAEQYQYFPPPSGPFRNLQDEREIPPAAYVGLGPPRNFNVYFDPAIKELWARLKFAPIEGFYDAVGISHPDPVGTFDFHFPEIIDPAVPMYWIGEGDPIPLTEYSISGESYFEYRTSTGLRVYNPTTGVQENDPFS